MTVHEIAVRRQYQYTSRLNGVWLAHFFGNCGISWALRALGASRMLDRPDLAAYNSALRNL
jgi:hypothetical protein